MIILGTNSIKATGFDVANSCRFNDGSSDYLTRTPSSSGNRDKYTLSFWFKRSGIGTVQKFFNAKVDGSNFTEFGFESSDVMQIYNYNSGSVRMLRETNRVFRDVSAWYHLVLKYDSSQSTASDRFKIYINGVEETSFSSSTEPALNEDSNLNVSSAVNTLGRSQGDTYYFDGYMAEVVLLDGTALAADSFGEFDSDSGIWKPIDVSGLTFGTNGFYLDFEDSSALGNDAAGSNNFTVNNLTAVDQSTDTCTNNFCTINALDNFYEAGTLAEGNLKYTANTGRSTYITSTFGVSTGRWYYEVLCSTEGSNSYKTVGFTPTPSTATNNWFGEDADHVSYYNSGKIFNNGSGTNYGNSWSANDILGCYLDLTSNKAYFSKNGVLQNSGTGYDISGAAFQTNDFWFFTVGMPAAQSPGTVLETNFGSPPFAISSGNTDDNGYGNFEYSPNITGDGAAKSFYALCTKNLAEYG